MITITTVLLLLANVGRALGQSSEPHLEWTRTLEDAATVALTAWSPTGSCVALATDTTVHVIDASGQPLWKWNFRETNRLIQVTPFGSLALSPTCDTVVLGGASDYKYVWAADRRGKHTFFRTVGTPLSVKFSLRGDTIGVVSGASLGYLLSPDLNVRWRGKLGDLPVRWPSQAMAGSQSQVVEFTREDVEVLFGAMMWGYGVSDSVSDDGQWRVVTNGQERGPRTTTIELWGPGAGGYRGRHRTTEDPSRPRWIKPMGCPGSELTRDGAFVIATGDPDHPDAYHVGDSPACDSGELLTYFFDRDGHMVLTWPHDRDRAEMAAAFLARTGVPLALQVGSAWQQDPAWDVALTPEEIRTLPETRRKLTYSPNGKRLLVSRDREVRLYRAPE